MSNKTNTGTALLFLTQGQWVAHIILLGLLFHNKNA